MNIDWIKSVDGHNTSTIILENKFRLNCLFGGWSELKAIEFLSAVPQLFSGAVDLTSLRA